MATTTIDRHATASENQNALREPGGRGTGRGKAETELRAAARRKGLTMKELANRMGVSTGYLSQIASGGKPWTPAMQEKAEALLGEVPGQGVVHRQGEVVNGGSSYIREKARELGLSMRELAERAGVTYGYMSQVSRGRRNMGVKVQERVESALECSARVSPSHCASVDCQAVWDRMDFLGISQNELARRAGVSSSHLSQVMTGQSNPSPALLKRLHGVLFQRTWNEERVVPAEVKVLGWRKGERSGTVVKGAGGPGHENGGGTIRTGGRVPWGAEVEYAYRAGYDGRGRLSVEHVVERGYSSILSRRESAV